ncbi:MAG: hypothetical protein U1E27_08295, partial [Kiritimatiellia bacterium]|nr:hypothetical protein [Kiritimatiellia bacterium]
MFAEAWVPHPEEGANAMVKGLMSGLGRSLGIFSLCGFVVAAPEAGRMPPHATYRVEAESLVRPQSWRLAESEHASGGFYWRSHSAGDPGYGDFMIPEPGRYTVWIRSRSGVGSASLQMEVAGTKLGRFGGPEAGEAPFAFQKAAAGVSLVPNRRYEIRLQAEAEGAGCDLLILTRADSYSPPSRAADLAWIEPLSAAATVSSLSGVRREGEGPSILLLHGARPWIAGETAAALRLAGCRVKTLDSRLLDGLGGARITPFLNDLHDPVASDGITPEFARLRQYAAVILMAIPPENQKRLLTDIRRRALETYVRNGGALLWFEDAPDDLESLTAVLPESGPGPGTTGFVRRPDSTAFRVTPPRWPYLGSGRVLSPAPGARTIAEWVDAEDRVVGVFAAIRPLGKGSVGFLNTEALRENQLRQFRNWAYFGAALGGMLVEMIGGEGLSPENTLRMSPPTPEAIPQTEATLSIYPPTFREIHPQDPARWEEQEGTLRIRFANGIELMANRTTAELVLEVGEGGQYRLSAPKLLSQASPVITDGSSEQIAVGGGVAKALASGWTIGAIHVEPEGGVGLDMTAGEYALRWRLFPRNLELDGRAYAGFMDRVEILQAPEIVESIQFETGTRLGPDLAGHLASRFACYASPRGFADIELDSGEAVSTRQWQFFCSGQPFTWLHSPQGVFSRFVDAPIPVFAEQRVRPPENREAGIHRLLLGKPAVPVSAPGIWHLFSEGEPPDDNAWMAMLQFQRIRLCRVAGVPQAQPVPCALYQNTCSSEEIGRAVETARALGFLQIGLPWAISALERMLDPDAVRQLHRVRDAGLRA